MENIVKIKGVCDHQDHAGVGALCRITCNIIGYVY